MHPRENWIFIQDVASSHTSNLVQDFLHETIPRRYVKRNEWPLKSPDSNPLDYYFWSKVKRKAYEGLGIADSVSLGFLKISAFMQIFLKLLI